MSGSWKVRKEQKKLWQYNFLSKLSSGMLTLVVIGLLLFFGILVYFATQVPSPEELSSRFVAQSTKIYDRDGELLYDIYENQNRTPVKLSEIPDNVKKATISIEDKDFYKHSGFSVTGIIRSVFNLAIYRKVEGGGSTLTQQLVKNALLTSETSVIRKLKEL